MNPGRNLLSIYISNARNVVFVNGLTTYLIRTYCQKNNGKIGAIIPANTK